METWQSALKHQRMQQVHTCRMGVMPVPPAIMDQCVAVFSSSPSRNLQE